MFIHNMSNIKYMFENSNLSWDKRKYKGIGLFGEKKQDIMRKLENEGMINHINMKIGSGKKLSSVELEYLKQNAPEMYQEIIKVQREREMFERRLNACKTKEEALGIYSMQMGSLTSSKQDNSKKEIRINAMENEWQKYTSKREYKNLPNTEKELEEKKEKISSKSDSDKDNNNYDKFDTKI